MPLGTPSITLRVQLTADCTHASNLRCFGAKHNLSSFASVAHTLCALFVREGRVEAAL
jgi:hypothetical protein